jgi:hypothetical protein
MQGKEIIVWVAKRDDLLIRLMYELGVQTLLCENYLEEELAQRMLSKNFRSGYLPSRPMLINNMNKKIGSHTLSLIFLSTSPEV